MQKKAFWLGLVLLAGVTFASQRPGAVFLMIWPAARPTALGGAFTPIADDASSVYYNPGGMGFMKGTHATLMHANWLPGLYPGMYYEYAGLTHEISGRGTAGFNFIYLTTGETEVIDNQGRSHGTYQTFDLSPAVAYGFPVLPNLGVGIGAKFIYSYLIPDWVFDVIEELRGLSGGIGITWALDFGALYKPWSFLDVGVSVTNLGPNISYTSSGESDPLPRMLRIGLAYYPVKTKFFTLGLIPELNRTLVGNFYDPDGTKSFSEELQTEWYETWKSLGIEGTFRAEQLGVSARAGYFEDLDGARGGIVYARENAPTAHYSLWDAITRKNLGKITKIGVCFGGGIEYARFKFDISIDQFIYDFDTNNYKFSFSYQF